ncbi:MAG: tetratricopeptide repeat protein [Planctomycetaceae bacterium]
MSGVTDWIWRLGVFGLATAFGSLAYSQEFAAPVVARVEMQLKIGEETVDVIRKGDLLTVLKEDGENYLILTHTGRQGMVSQVNAPKLEEAVEIYDELIKESPKEGRYFTLRASAWWARGDEIAALNDYDTAIENGYRESHAYSSRGMFHAAVGNAEKAIADFSEAITLDPKDEANYINRAAAYMGEKQYEKAVKDYTDAAAIKPRTSTYQQRAIAWKLQGNAAKAIEDFTEALKINPEHVPSLMGRGFVSFQNNDTQKAIEDFSAVISINPGAADAWNNRGFNRQLAGEFQEAIVDYNKATELAPKYALAWINKAWLLSTCSDEKVRNAGRAIEAATRACELTDFQDFNALKALAAAYAEDANFEKAIGWQEKAIERAPEAAREDEQKLLELYRDKKPFRVADISK